MRYRQEQALDILRESLGNPKAVFRDGQWEAIDALVNEKQKILVVQRTGWGKSAVYFIATRLLRNSGVGPTLIISPLLVLMRNQIDAAARFGVRALSINSSNRNDWALLNSQVLSNEVDLLLVSPERLANAEFVNDVLLPVANRIGLMVIDEAHCISDWGHDFRPDYRLLVNILRQMPPNMPLLGTTATANNRVLQDTRTQLGDIIIQRGSLLRESLALQTLSLPDQNARLAWLADNVPSLPGTGIIYTLTKRDADQVTAWLTSNNISTRAYYSDIESEDFENSDEYRRHLEELLLTNQIKAIVATVALGMGYDKPDIGFVIHYQAPGSIVAYYQQVGRAGRNIDHAVCVLMSGKEDCEIQEYFRSRAFPSEDEVSTILSALENSDGLSSRQLEGIVNLRQKTINSVLKYLSVENPSPIAKSESKWLRTPINYSLDHDRIRRLTEQREIEWQEVQSYINTNSCLMEYLALALDDVKPTPCGKCMNCIGKPVVAKIYSHESATAAARYLKQAEFPLICKKQVASGAFKEYGFSNNLPIALRAETGRILSKWGDCGWGHVVAAGKHCGHFGDDLLDAVAEMILQRWQPLPAPAWVTCVPSMKHPLLVPDFSQRLAMRLGLPFVNIVTKVRANEPQKIQQNRFHQCRNLDGCFAVNTEISSKPVLLIDDVFDSGWTLTIVAALLLQAGSGPVFPLALAASTVDG